VNQDGLKQAQKMIQDMANQMSALNDATKEAARQYGIFSKNSAKNELVAAKTAVEKEKAENLRVKRRIDLYKLEAKQNADLNKEKIREDKKYLEETNNSTKRFVSAQMNLFRNLRRAIPNLLKIGFLGKTAFDAAYSYIRPSLQKSYDFENFTFESGMQLSDFQRFQRLFNISGIRLSPQDIMQDMLNVQRNLTNVALNRGGELAAYKLTDVREGAQRGDLNAVINGIVRGVSEKKIDNSMLIQLMEMFGFGHGVEWARMIKENPQDSARLARTMIDEKDRRTIKKTFDSIRLTGFMFDNVKDQIATMLSPAFSNFSKGMNEFLVELVEGIRKGEFNDLFEAADRAGKEFLKWIKSLKKEDFKKFFSYMGEAANVILGAAKALGKSFLWIADHSRAIIGAIIGGIVGSITGTLLTLITGNPAFAAMGGMTGAALGGGLGMLFDNASKNENTGTVPDLIDEKIPDFMDDVVKDSSKTPARPNVVNIQNNNNITTTLNGIEDENMKEEYEQVVRNAIGVNQRGNQIAYARDHNILWVQGKTA
jgi:hypothetical protein